MLLKVWENILNILSGMAAGWGVALTQPVSPPELEISIPSWATRWPIFRPQLGIRNVR